MNVVFSEKNENFHLERIEPVQSFFETELNLSHNQIPYSLYQKFIQMSEEFYVIVQLKTTEMKKIKSMIYFQSLTK